MKIKERGTFTRESIIPYLTKENTIGAIILTVLALAFLVPGIVIIVRYGAEAYIEGILLTVTGCVSVIFAAKNYYCLIKLMRGKIIVDTDRVVDIKQQINGNTKNSRAKVCLSRYDDITLPSTQIDFIIGEDVYVIAIDNKKRTVVDILSKKYNTYIE